MRASVFAVLLPSLAAVASASIIRVPADVGTIQGALNVAVAGDTIQVSGGTYGENVVISKSDVRLVGPGFSSPTPAIVDGTGRIGFGIDVRGAAGAPVTNVEVSGMVVQNFERGIVLEIANGCRVGGNETRSNIDKETSVLDLGDGISLITANFNEIKNNFSHDNGHDGIILQSNSTTNVIRANRVRDNGAQRPNFSGCSIELAGPGLQNNNSIIDNDVQSGPWGIRIGPGGAHTGNLVARNRVQQHVRAGISVRGPSGGNLIFQNDATGNGIGNLAPSLQMDLYDESTATPNVWQKNRGRRALYIPVIGHVAGARSENFVSDLRLTSASIIGNTVTIDYFATSATGATAPTGTTTVAVQPSSESVLNDVLGTLFSTSGLGAFRIVADDDIVAASRVLNDKRATNEGTTGMLVPTMEIGDVCANGTLPLMSNASRSDLQNGIGFRTNLGYFNPLATAVSVTFTAKGSDATVMGTKTLAVPGFSRVQGGAFDVIDSVPEASRAQGEFFITYTVTGGPLIVYATVTDNKTGDGFYLPGKCNL
jgi:parallel beta-helix repeat protein